VEKLRMKGLVERNECPFDRRRVDVCITEKGLQLLEKASKAMDNDLEQMLAGVNEEEARVVNELLDKMRG
jgi:DNA-binding MarR family transcriptional regulator